MLWGKWLSSSVPLFTHLTKGKAEKRGPISRVVSIRWNIAHKMFSQRESIPSPQLLGHVWFLPPPPSPSSHCGPWLKSGTGYTSLTSNSWSCECVLTATGRLKGGPASVLCGGLSRVRPRRQAQCGRRNTASRISWATEFMAGLLT